MNTYPHASFLSDRFLRLKLPILAILVAIALPTLAQDIQPDVRPLAVGEKIERKVTGPELHIYAIELKRGQVLRVNFLEKGTDVGALVVRASDKQKVSAIANFGSGFMSESLTLIAAQDDAYGLIVRPQPISTGDAKYEMLASVSDLATEKDTLRARAEQLLEEANLIYINGDQARIPLAIAKLEECLKIWRRLGDSYWEGSTLVLMGGIFIKTEDFSRAETYFNAALKIFEATRNEPQIAAISVGLGTLYAMTKNEEKARIYIGQALRISRSLGDKRMEELIGVLNFRSLVSENQDQPSAPESTTAGGKQDSQFARELAAARAKQDQRGEALIWARTLFQYANDDLRSELRRPVLERAEHEALPLLKKIHDRDLEMQILVSLGLGLADANMDLDEEAEQAQTERAKIYLRQALLLSQTDNNQLIQAVAYMGLAGIYEARNDKLAIFFGKKMINAIQALRLTLTAIDKETQQGLTKKLGDAYDTVASDLFSEGRFEEALQVINYSRDQEFFDFKLVQSQQPARLALTARETENDQIFSRAVDRITAKYAARPEADYQPAADELQATLSQLEENFDLPASGKDIVRNVPDSGDLQSALRELASKTGKKYASLHVSIDSSEILLVTPESIKGFEAKGTYDQVRNDSAPLFEEIAKQVRAGTLSQEEAAKKVEEINQRAKQKMTALSAELSEDRIKDFLNALRSPDVDPRPLGSVIYKRIFKKIEKGDPNKTLEVELARYKPDVLLWSLDGDMRYIPMAALYDEENKQYLVEKYQNVVFTRARKERFLIEPKTWTSGVGFGTSVAHAGFPALPGVIKEIATIFGDATARQKGLFNGRVFLDRAFTRQALMAIPQASPALVHIASHFSFQPGDAQNSFLLLGDGSKLSLLDMQQRPGLFAGVDLLTLSACETAAQQSDATGKEIDGFAELAQRLGASSVIATLWKVSDDGTFKLMSEFYRLRQETPNATKSEILRQAQLNLLNGKSSAEEGTKRRRARGPRVVEGKSRVPFKPADESPFEHPYYWAPFVLFGSSR